MTTATYTANDIVHLEGLDAVRKRPGMYIGTTDSKGLTHLVFEVIDNAVDEVIAGYCRHIDVIAHVDGSIEVTDDGRGIPVDWNAKSGMTGIELVATKLHAGGKFGGNGYKTAGGLHGVGLSVVNALSARLDITVSRDGYKHQLSFRRGQAGLFAGPGPDAEFTPTGEPAKTRLRDRAQTGTTIRFWPDPRVFLRSAEVIWPQGTDGSVLQRCERTAFQLPALTIDTFNELSGDRVTYHYSGGLADMIDHIEPDKPLCETITFFGQGDFDETVPVLDGKGHMVPQEVTRTVEVRCALVWGTGYDTVLESFVNIVRTPLGGTHRKGFEQALRQVLVDAIKDSRGLLRPKEAPPVLDDCLEGLTAAISVRVPEPQFVGQTKEELGTKGVQKAVQTVVAQGLKNWLEGRRTKTEAKLVLTKIVNAARVRVTQKAKKDIARRKTALEGASMPAKLVDCLSTGTERSELFLVEGDSAAGSAKTGRASEYQALLPLRGKILNVQKTSTDKMLANRECASIIQVLGAGSGRTFDIEQMRYQRVIIMADADVDGSHIRTLLITLFARYMRPVIEAGRLYSAMPPLHKVETKGRNAETIYTYTQAEMEATVARLQAAGKSVVTPVPRFKGLGEMDSTELWSTTMNPATRSVRRITMSDARAAEDMLELLMGDKVPPRLEWLIDYADKIDPTAIDA